MPTIAKNKAKMSTREAFQLLALTIESFNRNSLTGYIPVVAKHKEHGGEAYVVVAAESASMEFTSVFELPMFRKAFRVNSDGSIGEDEGYLYLCGSAKGFWVWE